MKKNISMILAVAMLIGMLAGCSGSKPEASSAAAPAPTASAASEAASDAAAPAPEGQILVRIATQMAADNNTTIAMNVFGDYVMEKTNNAVKVEVYPNSQLGAEDIVMQQVLTGTLEMSPISSAVLSTVVPEVNIFSFPFLFNDLDTYIDMCWDEGFRERIFNAVEERTGCKTLGFTIGIGRGVSNTKREIRTVDDMKGLKIRTIGSPIIIDTFNSFGATATNVPWKEVYTALQQGLVDGEDSSVIANLDQKFIESNKFYTQLDTMFQNHLLVVSSELWNKLTPEQQQIFVEAGVKADEYGFECSRTDIKDSYERAAKEYPDFKITSDLTPEEKQTFVDACRPVWDKYKPEVGEDLFNYTYDLMQKMVKK